MKEENVLTINAFELRHLVETPPHYILGCKPSLKNSRGVDID